MFLPVALICSLGAMDLEADPPVNACTAITGSNLFMTEEDCFQDMLQLGVPYITSVYPGYEIVEFQCNTINVSGSLT
jgi:hypothetical protein